MTLVHEITDSGAHRVCAYRDGVRLGPATRTSRRNAWLVTRMDGRGNHRRVPGFQGSLDGVRSVLAAGR